MILFPAIDLKGGNCVRLLRGDMNEATIFNTFPGEQAVKFERAGCRWIHVVDLDGAVAGRSINAEAIDSILESVTIPIQVGGGIRNLEGIEYWLGRGVARVILGTAALKNPGHAVAFYESSELGDSKIAGYISPQASIVLTSEATADAQQAKITKDSKVAGKTVWLEKVSINCK